MSKQSYDGKNVCLSCGMIVDTKGLIKSGDYDNWAVYGICPFCFKRGDFPVKKSKKEKRREKREKKRRENE